MRNRCCVVDCQRMAIKKGFCDLHYRRWKRYGNPLTDKSLKANARKLDAITPEWLLENATPVSESGCFLWDGTTDVNGYARLWVEGKSVSIHRLIYEKVTGEDIADKHVCHHCDVPTCINPNHLFSGTAVDNMYDRHRKGRTRNQWTKEHYAAKDLNDLFAEDR